MGYHYGANATTFLVVGSILAVSGFIESKIIQRLAISKDQIINYFSFVIIVLTIAFIIKPGGPLLRLTHASAWQFQFSTNYHEAIGLIESDKSLTAQMTLGTALAHREELYWWPKEGGGSDYFLLSSNYATFPLSIDAHKAKIRELLEDSSYGIRYSSGDIILLEKGLNQNVALSEEMKTYLQE